MFGLLVEEFVGSSLFVPSSSLKVLADFCCRSADVAPPPSAVFSDFRVKSRPQILWLQNKPKLLSLHHRAHSWYQLYADVWCWGFLQTCCCALWVNISTLIHSKRLLLRNEIHSVCYVLFSWQPIQSNHTCSVFLTVTSWTNPLRSIDGYMIPPCYWCECPAGVYFTACFVSKLSSSCCIFLCTPGVFCFNSLAWHNKDVSFFFTRFWLNGFWHFFLQFMGE